MLSHVTDLFKVRIIPIHVTDFFEVRIIPIILENILEVGYHLFGELVLLDPLAPRAVIFTPRLEPDIFLFIFVPTDYGQGAELLQILQLPWSVARLYLTKTKIPLKGW